MDAAASRRTISATASSLRGCLHVRIPEILHDARPGRAKVTFVSPELGFLLFVALLWGPTALWLVYRGVRGPRSRDIAAFGISSSAPGNDPPVADVPADEAADFWICDACRSVNRRQSRHCYSCSAVRGTTPVDRPDESGVTPWVPVMAEGIARPAAMAVVTSTPTVMAGTAPVTPRTADAGFPAETATAPRAAVRAAVAATSATTSTTAAARPDASPQPLPAVSLQPAPEAVPDAPAGACPYLGLRADPATRFDFPDATHACHARSTTGRRRGPRPLRGARGRRPDAPAIAMDHQAAYCLSAAHRGCPFYPPAEG